VPHRLLSALTIAAAGLCLATAAADATARTTTVARGGTLRIRMAADWLAVCTAVVEYASGDPQPGATKHATNGWMTWTVPVARNRPLGRGKWYVRCGVAIRKSGTFVVVNPRGAG